MGELATKKQITDALNSARLMVDVLKILEREKEEQEIQSETAILRPSEIRVIDTLANRDVNVNGVALYLNLAVDTVNRHIRAAKDSTGCRTNYDLIKYCHQHGIIYYD